MTDLYTITQAIADRLSLIAGEPWAAAIPAHGHDDMRILRAATDHAEIAIERTHAGNRLVLSGSFWIDDVNLYDHRPDRDARHTITVAAGRPAAVIAREIARRLLPTYRADLAAALAAYDQAQRHAAWRDATIAELVAISGGRRAAMSDNMFYNATGRASFKARVSASSGVSFERIDHLPVEVARRILEILADEQLVRPA